MTYSNEYRLRRWVHPCHQESVEFVLAVAVLLNLAGGFYILASLFYIRPAQLYVLCRLLIAIHLPGTSLSCAEDNMRATALAPFFVTDDWDRKAVTNADKQNPIMFRHNFHGVSEVVSNSKAVTSLGRRSLQDMQLLIGGRYENQQQRCRENRPMVSMILATNLRFNDQELVGRHGRVALRNGRLTWR